MLHIKKHQHASARRLPDDDVGVFDVQHELALS
uniref:Uncharacterized protein n=1 Tax=Anguilla anguilla TaxID=7936 RepID=A0A0E9V9T6_ANGAN